MGKIGVPFFASRALLPLYTLVWTFTIIHLQVPLPLTRLKTAKETTYNLTPSTVYSQKSDRTTQDPVAFPICLWLQPEAMGAWRNLLFLWNKTDSGCEVWRKMCCLERKKFLAQNAKVRQRLGHVLQGMAFPYSLRSQTTKNQSHLQAFGQVPSLASCVRKASLLSVLQKWSGERLGSVWTHFSSLVISKLLWEPSMPGLEPCSGHN